MSARPSDIEAEYWKRWLICRREHFPSKPYLAVEGEDSSPPEAHEEMPPRVREVAARLMDMGFVLEQRGKGDHSIYRHPETSDVVVFDGGPSRNRYGASSKNASAGENNEDDYGSNRL
jgi:predicted RNA binding protein YcfA (HicA-like mRNA interferase family)